MEHCPDVCIQCGKEILVDNAWLERGLKCTVTGASAGDAKSKEKADTLHKEYLAALKDIMQKFKKYLATSGSDTDSLKKQLATLKPSATAFVKLYKAEHGIKSGVFSKIKGVFSKERMPAWDLDRASAVGSLFVEDSLYGQDMHIPTGASADGSKVYEKYFEAVNGIPEEAEKYAKAKSKDQKDAIEETIYDYAKQFLKARKEADENSYNLGY
jgi:hypothetical protein